MPSKNKNIIGNLRRRYEPHAKLSANVDLNHKIIHQLENKTRALEKKVTDLPKIHSTLSKSFGMQRKTLMRVLGLEERVAELQAAEAAVDQAVEELEEELEELSEEIPEGLDEILDDVRGDKAKKKKKPVAKKKPKKPIGKKITADAFKKGTSQQKSLSNVGKKRPKKPIGKKITADAFKKGTSQQKSLSNVDSTVSNFAEIHDSLHTTGSGVIEAGIDGADGGKGADGADGVDGAVISERKISADAFKKGTSQEVPEWFLKMESDKQAQRKEEERHAKIRAESIAADANIGSAQHQLDAYSIDAGTGETLSPEERKKRFRIRTGKISAESFKRGSSVGGAEKSVPADTTGASGIVKTDQAPDLSSDVTPEEGGGKTATAGLLAPLQAINSSLDNINKSFTEGAKADKDAADDARKADEKKKRKGAEGALEKIGGVAVKGVQAVLKPAMGIFQRIWEFLKTVFLGRIVMGIFDYFAKNQDKLKSLFKFIKDWWPVMVAGILAIFGPILGPGAWVIMVGALVWWGVNRLTALVKFVIDLPKNIWKFITGGGKDFEKAEKSVSEETKGFDDSDLKEGEGQDKEPSESAKLDEGQKAVDESQKLKEPGESGDDPEKMNKGGQVPGQGDTDTVPAMLTPGEFVMSKGAVQQYGVDTLEGMNAAAGGTNKPQEKEGVPAFKGGGLSLPRIPVRYYSGGGEVTGGEGEEGEEKKKGGFGGFLGGMIGKLIENNPIIKMILKPLIKGVKNLIVGVHNTMHGEQKASAKDVKPSAAKVTPATDNKSKDKGSPGGMASLGGVADALTGGWFDFDGKGGGGADIIKKMKGAGEKDIGPPVNHKHPVTVNYDNEMLQQQKPEGGSGPTSQELPSFDAGAMVSMSKIKTLGISV